MSELTRCNYCSMNIYKKRAKDKGYKLTVLKAGSESLGLGGVNVYMHPKDVKIDTDDKRDEYFLCWFMEIGSRCGC